jgi:hypothetical protein
MTNFVLSVLKMISALDKFNEMDEADVSRNTAMTMEQKTLDQFYETCYERILRISVIS